MQFTLKSVIILLRFHSTEREAVRTGGLVTSFMQFMIAADKAVFQALNSMAGVNCVLDWFIRLGADDHIIPVALTVLAILTIFLAKTRRERDNAFAGFMTVFLSVIISMVLLYAINNIFFRPRPFTSYEVNFLFYHNTDSAFPSNPATLLFAMSVAVLFYNRKVGSVMLTLGLYASFSRVAAGVHFPLDILGGVLLAVGSVFLARMAMPLLMPLAKKLTDFEYHILCSVRDPGKPRGEEPVRK